MQTDYYVCAVFHCKVNARFDLFGIDCRQLALPIRTSHDDLDVFVGLQLRTKIQSDAQHQIGFLILYTVIGCDSAAVTRTVPRIQADHQRVFFIRKYADCQREAERGCKQDRKHPFTVHSMLSAQRADIPP